MDYISRHLIVWHGSPFPGDMGVRKGTFALCLSVSGVDDDYIFIPRHRNSCSVLVIFVDVI